MLVKPKLCFSLGYFPVGSGTESLFMFQIHHQDERTRAGYRDPDTERRPPEVLNTPNGLVLLTALQPSVHDLPHHLFLLGNTPGHNHGGLMYRGMLTDTAKDLMYRIPEALSWWAENHPAFHAEQCVVDPEEPAGPVIIEPYELQKFVLP